MGSEVKLKGPASRFGPVSVLIFLILITSEILIRGVPLYSVWAFGAFFIIMGTAEYYRTKLAVYFIIGLLFGAGTWHSLVRFGGLPPFSAKTYFVHVLVGLAVLIIAWPTLYRSERLDTNARRLFKLAAELVMETADGFTPRPYSAGKAEYSREEIFGFAHFLNGKNIARSIVQKNGVTLAFSMGLSPLKSADPQKTSYVSFDNAGQVSVHISAQDYRRYKASFTFDQLCASLGQVFLRFLEYYQKGLDHRITNELKSGAK